MVCQRCRLVSGLFGQPAAPAQIPERHAGRRFASTSHHSYSSHSLLLLPLPRDLTHTVHVLVGIAAASSPGSRLLTAVSVGANPGVDRRLQRGACGSAPPIHLSGRATLARTKAIPTAPRQRHYLIHYPRQSPEQSRPPYRCVESHRAPKLSNRLRNGHACVQDAVSNGHGFWDCQPQQCSSLCPANLATSTTYGVRITIFRQPDRVGVLRR